MDDLCFRSFVWRFGYAHSAFTHCHHHVVLAALELAGLLLDRPMLMFGFTDWLSCPFTYVSNGCVPGVDGDEPVANGRSSCTKAMVNEGWRTLGSTVRQAALELEG